MRRVRLACSTGGLGWVGMHPAGLVWIVMDFGLVCIGLGWDASGWGGFWVGVNSKWKDFVTIFSIFSSAGGGGRKQSGVSSKEYLTILARLFFFVLKCLMHAPSKNDLIVDFD